jgi:hypothetical protein
MMRVSRFAVPDLGVGVGLRVPHYAAVLDQRPAIGFFEVISENFMVEGGKPLVYLDRVRELYPVVTHAVSLNIGGPDALDRSYLTRLKQLVRHVNPPWVSDHFCFSASGSAHVHDLLPLPYTSEVIRRVAERARVVQEFLEVPFALENTSSYLSYVGSELTEWQFISEVVERADIGLLFDVNNVYVTAHNHELDAREFVRGIPYDRVVQIHVAGHTNVGTHIIDTHRGPVSDPVWQLYGETIALTGAVSTSIEWDDHVPALPVLLAEAERAVAIRDAALATRGAASGPAA